MDAAARVSARLAMKGWFIPAPAPCPRTRRYLGFGGVSRRAETSLPGAVSNRRCFGWGIAHDQLLNSLHALHRVVNLIVRRDRESLDQDFSRRGGKGPTLPKAGRMGDPKRQTWTPTNQTDWRRVNLIRSYAGLEAENGKGVCGFEPCGLRRVDYVQGISGADHLRFFEPGGVAEILSRRDQLSDWAHRHDREYGDVYRYAVSPV